MSILTNVVEQLQSPMSIILLITAISSIAVYWAYQPLSGYVRGQKIKTDGDLKGNKKTGMLSSGIEIESSIPEEQKKGKMVLAAVLAAGCIIRLIGAVSYRGYEADVNCFLSWADLIFDNGIGNFYKLDAFTDYPPGYMYVLFAIGGIRSAFGIEQSSLLSLVLTKLPAILCDLAISYLIYKIAKKKFKESGAAILAGIFLVTPSIFWTVQYGHRSIVFLRYLLY